MRGARKRSINSLSESGPVTSKMSLGYVCAGSRATATVRPDATIGPGETGTARIRLDRDVVVKPLFGGEGRGIARLKSENLAHGAFRPKALPFSGSSRCAPIRWHCACLHCCAPSHKLARFRTRSIESIRSGGLLEALPCREARKEGPVPLHAGSR